MANKPFWKLEHLSDGSLLKGLERVLHAQRQTLAELIAHLGEVEERRLHLAAAHGSLFSYCVQRLGMSEDEACRRIELARLARRFPALFPELASGAICLSVALLLKPVLSDDNQRELIAAARGATLAGARELVATFCPRPDVPSKIRKLPESQRIPSPHAPVGPAVRTPLLEESSLFAHPATTRGAPEAPPALETTADAPVSAAAPEEPARKRTPEQPTAAPAPAALVPPRRASQRIEPLAPQRYRIQFTAGAELKRKLELARDLLRHVHPDGDFAPVVSRALDLLLNELERRRFGGLKRRNARPRAAAEADEAERPPHCPPNAASAATPAITVTPAITATPATAKETVAATPASAAAPVSEAASAFATAPAAAVPAAAAARAAAAAPAPAAAAAFAAASAPAAAAAPASTCATVPPAIVSPPPDASHGAGRHIARPARRLVSERDGLGCSWVSPEGVRCSSHAWLELDHRQPFEQGGSSQPENLRWLCSAHNRFAAERAYGRAHVQRAIAARRRLTAERDPRSADPVDPPCA